MTRLVCVSLIAALAIHAQPGKTPAVDPASIDLYFEPNLGQADGGVKFLARGAGGMAAFRSDEVVFQLGGAGAYSMRLAGARPAEYRASEKVDGVSAYFLSTDQSRWLPSVPHYGRLTASGVYEGIDAVYYSAGSRLEYDFVVKPGADASQIRLEFSEPVRIQDDGSLSMSTGRGEVVHSKPRVYQMVDGEQVEVEASYRLDAGGVQFKLGRYDRTLELVIDPVVVFASTFPGYVISAVATDSSGATYLAGYTSLSDTELLSLQSPLSVGAGWAPPTSFLAKLVFNPTSRSWQLAYASYFAKATILRMKVNAQGQVYMAGVASDPNFVLINALPYNANFGNTNGFAAKIVFDSVRSALSIAYSTLLPYTNFVYALDVDSSGSAYVGGFIYAGSPLQEVNPTFPNVGGPANGGFVARLTQSQSGPLAITYSTRITDSPVTGIHLDPSGNLIVTGLTTNPNFPLVNNLMAADDSFRQRGFAMKIGNPGTGRDVQYSTPLPFPVSEAGLDAAGNLYLTGEVLSDYPQVLPYVNPLPAGGSRWVAMLKHDSARRSLQLGYFTPAPSSAAGTRGFAVSGNGSVLFPARRNISGEAGVEDTILKLSRGSGEAPYVEYDFRFDRLWTRPDHTSLLSELKIQSIALYPDGSLLTGGTAINSPFLLVNGFSGGQMEMSPTKYQAISYFARIADGVQAPALAVSKSGLGSVISTSGPAVINCGAVCSAAAGGIFNLTALAGSGYQFTGWSGACAGTGPCTVNVDSLKQVHATFGRVMPLTIDVTGSGKVVIRNTGAECTNQCTYNFPATTLLKLDAIPAAGSQFKGWSSQGLGTAFAYASTELYSGLFNGSITARFETQPAASTEGLLFVPIGPCRVIDTRDDLSIGALDTRTIQINRTCGTSNVEHHPEAAALNFTVVPREPLSYITTWPAGLARPVVSTLNSLDARIKATGAIVPATLDQRMGYVIDVFSTNRTDLVIDNFGFFIRQQFDPLNQGLAFYPVTPCRLVDTRNANGPLGGPRFTRLEARTLPVTSSPCGIPSTARAYSLNATVVPEGPLSYITIWPTGMTQPTVSTLNALTGAVTANAAITPAGVNRSIDAFFTNNAHFVLDINGYFAPPGQTGGLKFYPVAPCRISDTRNANGTFGGPIMAGQETRDYPIPSSACGIPSTARAYSLSATVVPTGVLGYLTLWPQGQPIPIASTLNATDGAITSNAAIVPAGPTGAIRAFTSNQTHLILDINGYFAP